jgi:hypothetical protein
MAKLTHKDRCRLAGERLHEISRKLDTLEASEMSELDRQQAYAEIDKEMSAVFEEAIMLSKEEEENANCPKEKHRRSKKRHEFDDEFWWNPSVLRDQRDKPPEEFAYKLFADGYSLHIIKDAYGAERDHIEGVSQLIREGIDRLTAKAAAGELSEDEREELRFLLNEPKMKRRPGHPTPTLYEFTIWSAVKEICGKYGLKPRRNEASNHESGCSLVCQAMARHGVHVAEPTIRDIFDRVEKVRDMSRVRKYML